MATIRKRPNDQWQVQVRKKGYPTSSKTFSQKSDAKEWASVIESEMVRGVFVSRAEAQKTNLADLIARYRREITPSHKGFESEDYRLRALQKHPLASCIVANLRNSDFARFRDHRLMSVKPATVVRELTLLQQVIQHARREWDIALPDNPVALVRRPRFNNERCRRLSPEEEILLITAIQPVSRNVDGTLRSGVHTPWLYPVVMIALETAMRQSEIAGLRWSNVNLQSGTAYLPDTKNGRPRDVPLSRKAREILGALPRSSDGRVFPVTANAIKLAWQRCVKSAGFVDLHFHDLRHEATSRLALRVPNVIELASITGHRDVNMLRRYYHTSAAELATRIG
jgi:integrase